MWRTSGYSALRPTPFALGLLAGATTTSLCLWTLGGLVRPLPETLGDGMVVAAATLCVLREFRVVRFTLLENRRQVPRGVVERGPVVGALIFGTELGTGMRTRLTTSLPYVAVAVLVFGRPHIIDVLVIAVAWAAGRMSMPVLRQFAPDRDRWLDRLAARLRWTNRVAAVGVFVAAAAWGVHR